MSKILIVEDDRMIAERIQNHLETWGYEAVIAENFQNILEDVTKTAPDLNLVDDSMTYQGKRVEFSKNEAQIMTLLMEHG